MRDWPNSSRASAVSPPAEDASVARVEWRPSPMFAAGLAALGVLAGCAVLASEIPRGAAWCLALAAALHGARLAARERARPVATLLWDGHAGVVRLDGIATSGATLTWRGPLAFVRCRDARGRMRRLAFWPDTLDARGRRALRLAAGGGGSRAPGPDAGAAGVRPHAGR